MDISYTYILECDDGSLYTGWTNDLDRRLAQHQNGTGARYTRPRRPVRLIRFWSFETRQAAMSCEARFKRLTRKAKEQLARHIKPPEL